MSRQKGRLSLNGIDTEGSVSRTYRTVNNSEKISVCLVILYAGRENKRELDLV